MIVGKKRVTFLNIRDEIKVCVLFFQGRYLLKNKSENLTPII